MRTYDLYVFRNGRWEIQATFANGEDALSEANRAVYAHTYPGIRVTEETLDANQNVIRTRSIFNREFGLALDKAGMQEWRAARLRQARSRNRQRNKIDQSGRKQLNGTASMDDTMMPMIYLVMITVFGFMALRGLNILFGFV